MPAVCRGDSVDADLIHCSTPKRDKRSSNVFCNGTGISRQGDNNTTHKLLLLCLFIVDVIGFLP